MMRDNPPFRLIASDQPKNKLAKQQLHLKQITGTALCKFPKNTLKNAADFPVILSEPKTRIAESARNGRIQFAAAFYT